MENPDRAQDRAPDHAGDDAGEVGVSREGHVATVLLRRPPNNHLDLPSLVAIAEALEALDRDPDCRAVVLAAEGRHFCAGADLANRAPGAGVPRDERTGRTLYREAARLLRTRKPVVAAVHGAAIGAGLGLACTADFRVTCAEARFAANFARLGFHPGFGLTALLPRLVGAQRAALLFYTGRRIGGEEAAAIGLADRLVPQAEVRAAAAALAHEIAGSAPLAVQGVRETLRRGLADEYERATEREFEQQAWQRQTEDYREGVRAMAERREPVFKGG
ncbi:enoyl-CoA hydratase/isomerase family protein [Roseomonas sp. NAR14]|uniref:Enoyl-CoA hydratase/isomerase family protein n=1 Tax=Roseomonas acroporae TaxID=2937791 RepID=A0A9X2BVG7_9PROT|nr:enoyl-CoA hydratase/isomerase family protein [Roseomonas acroporae]MCK8786672.1 enoyl-CoA hydratase/isomerase family protein [Roseomonas acroporae]